jgi:hypothetical protein
MGRIHTCPYGFTSVIIDGAADQRLHSIPAHRIPPRSAAFFADASTNPSLRYTIPDTRVGGALVGGIEEGEIASGLANGGRILGIFAVERRLPGRPGYVVYLRTTWNRGFHCLKTYRGRSDRVYRDLDRLVRLIRDEFRYGGPITLFVAGASELRRFRALLPQDGAKTALSHSGPRQPAKLRPGRKRYRLARSPG